MENHYRILNVARNATESEVCRAYRDAVRRCHPDLHPGDRRARERFLRIQAAFEVLGNPEKRKAYDPDKAVCPPRTGRPKRRRGRTHLAPSKEAIFLQRVAWCAHMNKVCSAAISEQSALKAVKIWTLASTVLAYLAMMLVFYVEVAS